MLNHLHTILLHVLQDSNLYQVGRNDLFYH